MASITEKRRSLHAALEAAERENEALRQQVSRLWPLANMGRAACMIAHEINNLLTPVKSYASLALINPDDRPLAEKAFTKAVANCDRASLVMEAMLAMAKGERQAREQCVLAELVEDVFVFLSRDFARDGITVLVEIPAGLTVRVMPAGFGQVLMNLILNARDAMLEQGGILTISAEKRAGNVEIEVRDTGDGIDPDDMENVFESFFTTKLGNAVAGRSGAGLGLAYCKEIVDAHDGVISVDSERASGTTFRISIPTPHSGRM